MQRKPEILTIGHSTHELAVFLDLLKRHDAEVVADVRSSPYSRFNPQFNREILKKELRTHGIRYVFLGEELGARSDDPSCYENGRVQYERLVRTEPFRSGIKRIERGASEYRVCLLCAEKDPLECHRTILVSKELVEHGSPVSHILADGSIETHEEAMSRLLEITGLSMNDLFNTREQLLTNALKLQAEKIAFVNHDRTNEVAEIG